MGIIKRTETEWQEIVERQRESGQTQKAWCTANGVGYWGFLGSVQRLRNKGIIGVTSVNGMGLGNVGQKNKGWVEIRPSKASVSVEVPADGLLVEVGAFRIVVSGNFEEVAFKRVCKALAEIC